MSTPDLVVDVPLDWGHLVNVLQPEEFWLARANTLEMGRSPSLDSFLRVQRVYKKLLEEDNRRNQLQALYLSSLSCSTPYNSEEDDPEELLLSSDKVATFVETPSSRCPTKSFSRESKDSG